MRSSCAYLQLSELCALRVSRPRRYRTFLSFSFGLQVEACVRRTARTSRVRARAHREREATKIRLTAPIGRAADRAAACRLPPAVGIRYGQQG